MNPNQLTRSCLILVFALTSNCWWPDAASLHAQEQTLFAELYEVGLDFTQHQRFTLAPPTLRADMSPAARSKAVENLAGKQGWERFARDSVNAPVVVDISSVDDPDGNRLGLRVHSAFVVYTQMATLRDSQLMEQFFGSVPSTLENDVGSDSDARRVVMQELSAEELIQLGFVEQADSAAAFAYIELPLLNKVLLEGIIRVERRERPGAVEFAWRLDPSFNSLEKYACRWTRLERNAVGRLVEGEAYPYTGCGGWIGAYEIGDSSEQLLIESRMLLQEPSEWFAGSHFLRSKLPLMLQENARSFRRKLPVVSE